jgi:transketolase
MATHRKRSMIRRELYKKLLHLLYSTNSYHIGSCLSCIDIIIQTQIYTMKEKDVFILSKGHAAPALYIVLNQLKKISDDKLSTFTKEGTLLPAHPPYNTLNGIPYGTGSLGHGLSFSCGIAHGLQIKSKQKTDLATVFCLMSDGECNEGQVWEAAQYASHFKLKDLIVLIDKNGLQAFGTQKEVLGDSATAEKWSSFGFEVYTADGHNLEAIGMIYEKIFLKKNDKPKVILLKTVKGNGISFMKNTLESHYMKFTKETYLKAIAEIEKNIL